MLSAALSEAYRQIPQAMSRAWKLKAITRRSDADNIVSGKAITGQLHSSSDEDYFAITASAPGIISVNFDTSSDTSFGSYFDVSLIGPDGAILASQKTIDDNKGGEKLNVSAGIDTAGIYYAVVGVANSYNSKNYKLTAQMAPSDTTGVETEPNNTRSDSDNIVSGKAITGQLHSRSDEDYFAITASAPGIISVNFDTSSDTSFGSYFDVSLIGPDGAILASQKTTR